jgi:hypothetical protein
MCGILRPPPAPSVPNLRQISAILGRIIAKRPILNRKILSETWDHHLARRDPTSRDRTSRDGEGAVFQSLKISCVCPQTRPPAKGCHPAILPKQEHPRGVRATQKRWALPGRCSEKRSDSGGGSMTKRLATSKSSGKARHLKGWSRERLVGRGRS